jgi:penicillin-binding protein 1C
MRFPRFSLHWRRLLWLIPVALLLAALWPLPGSFLHPKPLPAVQIEDRNGKLLYEARGQDSGSFRFIALKDMPQSLLDAVVSIEDRGFYDHGGVSIRGTARALWQNLSTGRIVSGGSTLTQQLVRIRLKPDHRGFLYKAKEAVLALKLDSQASKDEILESYLNTAYFGHQAYGIAAAARTFFGVSPPELSTAQSALLAGLVQSPASLDPFANMKRAKERQTRVLDAMKENGTLTQVAYDAAMHEPIVLAKDRVAIRAPHFVFWLQGQRPDAFEMPGHLKTTVDLNLQTDIEDIVRRKLAELNEKNVTSAAVVVLDAKTGDILSMVGSADYFDAAHDGAVNVAVSARQPGSALKPFTYALALEHGDTPATTVADVETQFFTKEGNPYTPRNYDYGEHGLVRYREALANSYNIAAVKVLQKIGVGTLLQFLKSAGIGGLDETPEHYGLALTLGDSEVTLLDLVSAYGIFPRGGLTLHPRALPSDAASPGVRVLSAQSAWLITSILSDDSARLPEFGEDGPLSFGGKVAAKTGTTRNSRDNWTIGYSPDVLVGVWVGNADNSPMRGTSGVTGAGPIFHDVMLSALSRYPSGSFAEPSGIAHAAVCRLSGKLPTPECPSTIQEVFAAGSVPTAKDDIFRAVPLDTRNGLLASDGCDPRFVKREVFAVFPPEVKTWARENGWKQPPTQRSPLCGGTSDSSATAATFLQILAPQPNDSFLLDPLIPDSEELVIFKAQASDDVRSIEWYVNGAKVGTGLAPSFRYEWKPGIGKFEVKAMSGAAHDTRTIEVGG